MHPETTIAETFLSYFWNILSDLWAISIRNLFCSSINRWSTHLAEILLLSNRLKSVKCQQCVQKCEQYIEYHFEEFL